MSDNTRALFEDEFTDRMLVISMGRVARALCLGNMDRAYAAVQAVDAVAQKRLLVVYLAVPPLVAGSLTLLAVERLRFRRWRAMRSLYYLAGEDAVASEYGLDPWKESNT